eukprot:jgi/Mesvir1/10216/Mv08536-RA.1
MSGSEILSGFKALLTPGDLTQDAMHILRMQSFTYALILAFPLMGAKAREKVKSERYGLNMGALAAAVCVSMTDNFLKGGMSGLKTAIGWFNVLVMAAVLYGSYYVALLV